MSAVSEPTSRSGGLVGEPPTGLRATVVICAYTLDRWQDITAAVESVRRQTSPPAQVILISDHNRALLQRARESFVGVTCLPNAGPQGLSGARNTGVGAATAEVVAFLDDDAAADPDWLRQLLAAYSEDGVMGVGGGVLPAWRAPRPQWFPEEFLWVLGCTYEGLPRTRAEVRNPIGANMSFRRDIFSAIGGFDTNVGRLGKDAAGCEETEFAIRARRARPSTRILLEPSARCRHSVTPDRVTRRYFRRRCWAEGRSKALVSRLSGAESALSSERVYIRRILPAGVLRGLRELMNGDLSGATRAWAIIEGTALTTAGYLAGRARLAWSARSDGPT